ncbi:unnamed protein product [Amaranthus hypochondriacus]
MSSSGRSIRHYVEQELGSVPHFVIYAILEWTLIGLLFLDGFLTFISSEFADFFDLQSPCVLCTRIDHVLTRHRTRFCYNETICDGHKKDLSSLAFCHVHRNLSDIRTMCEGCLLSFATDKSFNGVRSKDLEGMVNHEMKARLQLRPLWSNSGNGNGNGNEKLTYCSCCGEPMKVKPSSYEEVGNGNSNRLVQQAPAPSPRAPFSSWRGEDARTTLELSNIRCQEIKLSETTTLEEEDSLSVATPFASKEERRAITTPRPTDTDESIMEDFGRTLSFSRGNRFFGISDSAASSPRYANRMPRKSLIEKVELGSDPVETITGNETDTEIILTRLKKQVRSDRKSLIALYMELDEERSAAAVAANNAMAMITRLQAEKASVQMEALQYQRMMEEQAEYDKEDIQMLKEFVNKKEDEIRELENELELYRDRFGLPHVSRGDGFERSQSFSSITEHGSPLFSIVATDTEMDVNDHISDKSGSGSSFGDGEHNGLNYQKDEYYLGGFSYQDFENVDPKNGDHNHHDEHHSEGVHDMDVHTSIGNEETIGN